MRPFNLVGVNGNAYAVMGYVKDAMRRSGKFSQEEIDAYMKDAKSSDYDNLLYVSGQMVETVNDRLREAGELEEEDDEEEEY